MAAGFGMLPYSQGVVSISWVIGAVSLLSAGALPLVEAITLGYTTLRTSDGRLVVLPNSAAASQVTINLTNSQAGAPLPPTGSPKHLTRPGPRNRGIR